MGMVQQTELDRIAKEFEIHRQVDHANIIKFKGYFYNTEGDLCILLERMDKTLLK